MLSSSLMKIEFVHPHMPSIDESLRPRVVTTTNTRNSLTRRHALRSSGIALLGVLAGCTELVGTEPNSDEYYHLQERSVYVERGVDLTIPEAVQTVAEPEDADLIVLPDTPGIEASQAVEWLEHRRVIALLGGESQRTWLSWRRSDAYVEAFDPSGMGEGDPPPELLLGWYADSMVHTSHHSWGYEPSESDYLAGIDETLEDIDL